MIAKILTNFKLKKELVFILCLIFGIGVSIFLEQDANFDLLNYHLYNGHAFLQGKTFEALLPADIQSFYNPLADLPYAIMAMRIFPDSPRMVAALQGIYFGLLIYVGLAINFLVFRNYRQGSWMAIIATVIGISGSMIISQTGTTTNEQVTAFFVLTAVYLAINLINRQVCHHKKNVIIIGALAGFAAALKLTAAIYCPALAIAMLFASKSIRIKIRFFTSYITSFVTVYFIFASYWILKIYSVTGNPLFPYFNNFFKSNWLPARDFNDQRFLSRDWWQVFFYPFYWAKLNVGLVTEIEFRDARIASAYIALLFILGNVGAAWVKERVSYDRNSKRNPSISQAEKIIIVFFIMSYVLWQYQFSILRYAIPIELLSGTVLTMALVQIINLLFKSRHTLAISLLGFIAVSLLILTTKYPDWGRVKYGEKVFSVAWPLVPDNSLVVVIGAPISYVLPFAPKSVKKIIGINSITIAGFQVFQETRKILLNHRGPVLALVSGKIDTWLRNKASQLGVYWNYSDCTPIVTNIKDSIFLCIIKK